MLALATAWLVAAATPASAQTVDEAMAAIEGAQPGAEPGSLGALTLDQLMDSLNVPGLSIAVIHDFEIHWAKGYGVRDVATGAPVDTETIFQAASISKPVAAMGSLKAAQDRYFDLDQDINQILTSWQLDGEGFTENRPVTPRTLMSHTSGLGDAFGYPGYDPAGPFPTAVQTLDGHPLSNTRPLFMEREPMTAFEYSGGGVTLQQVALSDALNRPFAEILWADVLGPLGMRRSSFTQPMPLPREENAAAAHNGAGERSGEARWHVYPEQAAAGLWTTASDLARFMIEVQLSVRGESNVVLDRAHAREMITPVGVGDYAVGFGLRREGAGWYFGHGGSNWGFRGDVVAHVSNGYGLTQMTNGDRGGQLMQEIRSRVQRVYGWDTSAEPVPRGYRAFPDRPTVEVSEGELARYAGEYERTGDLPVVVDLVDGQLRMSPEGEGVFPLRPVGAATFILEGANGDLVFEADGAEIGVFLLRIGGTQRTWVRAGR
jgi:CubicO group peptidase (beta-lactamase class C family)